MAISNQTKVRNLKSGDWYWIDRKVLKLYGKRIGPSGLAVYNALASFADSKKQSCFPTRKKIALILGLSRRTVTRKINILQNLDLIYVEKVGISYRYFLLELSNEETKKSTGEEKKSNHRETPWSTNNNKISRFNINKPPRSREELLAHDLAEALNDRENISVYLFYANKYPETLLRRTLGEVNEIPDEKIIKGRAALFHCIIRKYAQRTHKGFGG